MILKVPFVKAGKTTRHGQSGMTMVEMLVGAAIFAFFVMVLYGILKTCTAVYFTDSTRLDLQQQARNGLDRIVREARESKASSVTVVDADSDKFTFSTPTQTDIVYYRSGVDLVREYPPGTITKVATDITHLKFTKTSAQLTINIQAQRTAYNKVFNYKLVENIKLRNE